MIENVTWLGHASFRVSADIMIYLDPWKVKDDLKADLILITHPHHDHCSEEDVAKLLKDSTIIIAVQEAAVKLAGLTQKIKIIKPGDSVEVQGVLITAIPAYNKIRDFHPKANKWVGYVVEVLGERLYFAGDTDFIPEMNHLNDITVAFLPIGGTYTMNVEDAAKAAVAIHPKYAVPMHYGDIVGQMQSAEDFRAEVERLDPTIEVMIKEEE
jgi:L-ascorbate metabolism protein UlaG (beta-lactamase superfamily)